MTACHTTLLKTYNYANFQQCLSDIDACVSICTKPLDAQRQATLSHAVRIMKPGSYFLCISQPQIHADWAWWLEDQGLCIKDQIAVIKHPVAWTIIMAMRDYEQNYANNAIVHGVAGLNIEKMRIGDQIVGWNGLGQTGQTWNKTTCGFRKEQEARPVKGRFPGNLISDIETFDFLSHDGILPQKSEDYISVFECSIYNLYCYCLDLISPPDSLILNPFCDDDEFARACINKKQQAIIVTHEKQT
jgi:hypothetical protein